MATENTPHQAPTGWLTVLAVVTLSASMCILLGLPTYRAMRQHNARLASIEQELTKLPLPQGMERVGVHSKVGLISGSGNHCDYLAIIVLRGDVERTVLEEFYRQYTVSSPGGYPLEIRIGAGGHKPAPEHEWFLSTFDWIGAPPAPVQQVRLVYVFDASHDPEGDPRCH